VTAPRLSVVVAGPGEVERRLAFGGEARLWIGRDADCDVVLPSPFVSRRHAMLAVRRGEVVVTDASANGTIVEGHVVHRTSRALPARGRVEIGAHVLEVALAGGPEPEEAPEVAPVAPAAVAGAVVVEPPRPAQSTSVVQPELRRRIHRRLVDGLDLAKVDPAGAQVEALRAEVIAALERIVEDLASELPEGVSHHALVAELCDEALGLGPLEPLLSDRSVSEIMVVDPETIFVERAGRITRTPHRFTDAEAVRAAIERIVTPLGRRIDESVPLVDARLPDGSRVNAIIPPLAIRGPCITIRKFKAEAVDLSRLVQLGAMAARMALFLERSVRARRNIVVSGGTGSGKTTLLNALSFAIPAGERVVTIEDAAELRLAQPHVVSLEARPPNLEGKGAYTIRDLLRNALRMRPDRVIVGECRGGEALDMLQAMNTGHEGSMTTTHANGPHEALARLETLCLMSGLDLPVSAIRGQLSSSVHLVVQTARLSDGSRRVVSISEVCGVDDSGALRLEDVFVHLRRGVGAKGEVLGEFAFTGYLPTFLDLLASRGLVPAGDYV
jgi:pilus assembly protein CpaF